MINPDLVGNGQDLHYGKRKILFIFLFVFRRGTSFFFFYNFWLGGFIYWVVSELFLRNFYQITSGLLIFWQCTFKIQHSLIYFLQTQISFIKHILQNYQKKVFLDFSCHGNQKLNLNNECNKFCFFYAIMSKTYKDLKNV